MDTAACSTSFLNISQQRCECSCRDWQVLCILQVCLFTFLLYLLPCFLFLLFRLLSRYIIIVFCHVLLHLHRKYKYQNTCLATKVLKLVLQFDVHLVIVVPSNQGSAFILAHYHVCSNQVHISDLLTEFLFLGSISSWKLLREMKMAQLQMIKLLRLY